MYCGKCGRDAKVYSRFCTHCGERLEIDCHDIDAATPTETAGPEDTSLADSNKKLSGVKGWLYFFCLRNVFLAPMFTVPAIFGASADLFSRGLFSLLVLAEFTAGVAVWRISARAFLILKIYFVVLIFVGLILLALGGLLAEEGQGVSQLLITGGLEEISWAFIWFAYFRTSKRVLATFGKTLGMRT